MFSTKTIGAIAKSGSATAKSQSANAHSQSARAYPIGTNTKSESAIAK